MRRTLIALIAGVAIGYAVQCDSPEGPSKTIAALPEGAAVWGTDGLRVLTQTGHCYAWDNGVWARVPTLDPPVPMDSLATWGGGLATATDGRAWVFSTPTFNAWNYVGTVPQ